MTIHQFRRQGFREGHGEVYYGPRLARVIEAEQKPSVIYRAVEWYERNAWKIAAWTAAIAVCAGAAYGIVGAL